MELEPADLPSLLARRRAKVDELRVRSFSWAHETQAAAASGFRLREGRAEIGYALIDAANAPTLLEFGVDGAWRGRAASALEACVKEHGLREMRVRTDDGLACEVALAFASRERWDVRPAGPIYALETGVLRRPPKPEQAEVRALAADAADSAAALLALDSSIESPLAAPDAVVGAAREDRLWGLYRGGALVGAALAVPLPSHRYVGIRPAVHPDHRRAGLATYLVGEVSQALLLANRRLIAEAEALDRGPRRIAEHLGLTLAAHHLRIRAL